MLKTLISESCRRRCHRRTFTAPDLQPLHRPAGLSTWANLSSAGSTGRIPSSSLFMRLCYRDRRHMQGVPIEPTHNVTCESRHRRADPTKRPGRTSEEFPPAVFEFRRIQFCLSPSMVTTPSNGTQPVPSNRAIRACRHGVQPTVI